MSSLIWFMAKDWTIRGGTTHDLQHVERPYQVHHRRY